MNNNYIKKYKKKINNYQNKENNITKYLKNFIARSLIVIILFLSLAIIIKSNKEYKEIIKKNIYETNFSFTTFKNLYTKYLGGISFLDKMVEDVKPVFNNELKYKNASKYFDGVSLEVDNNYLVPVLETGIVVYIGKKDNYGDCIIIQGMDGIEILYSDIRTTSLNLYDYIEKGDLLGEVKDNHLNLVYSKDGKILNYEEYIK